MKPTVLAIATVLLLTGCATTDQTGNYHLPAHGDVNGWSYIQDLPDGRQVICVGSTGGGLSCDWSNVK